MTVEQDNPVGLPGMLELKPSIYEMTFLKSFTPLPTTISNTVVLHIITVIVPIIMNPYDFARCYS